MAENNKVNMNLTMVVRLPLHWLTHTQKSRAAINKRFIRRPCRCWRRHHRRLRRRRRLDKELVFNNGTVSADGNF